MKIVIAGGANEKWMSLELIYQRYLKQEVDCVIFPMQNKFMDYYEHSLVNKIFFRMGWKNIYKKINKEFIEFIETQQPDVVWVFKGMELFPETLAYIKTKGIIVCCYNPDHPFIHSGKGSGNSNVVRSFGHYDFHFVYGLDFIKECEQKGVDVYPLPFAYDLSAFENAAEIFTQNELYNKACFIGNPDKERARFIEAIAAKGIPIDVYGNNWQKFVNSSNNININGVVYGLDLWKTFRKYRVQLNLLRKHNLNSHNQRTFELAGAGAIQIAPRTPDHELYFTEGKEIYLFNDEDECVLKMHELFNLSDHEANELRKNTMARVEANKYMYKSRAKFVFDTLKERIKEQ